MRAAYPRPARGGPPGAPEESMEQIFALSGLHCGACVARAHKALEPLADAVSVTLDPPQAVLDVPAPLALDAVNAALAAVGDYRAEPA